MPLRIGTLFVILVTSALGVFLPMLLIKLPFQRINTMFSTVIKQFGTGVILSTAFVHVRFLPIHPRQETTITNTTPTSSTHMPT